MWEQPDDNFDDGYDGSYVDDYKNDVKSDIFKHSRKGYVDRDDLYDPNKFEKYYNSDDEYYNSEDEYYGPEGVNWERLEQEDIFRRRKEGEEAAKSALRYKQYRGPVQYPEMQPQFRERALRRDLQKVQDREASLKSKQRAILEAEKVKLFFKKRQSIPKRILTPEAKLRVKDISSENIALKKESGNKMPSYEDLRKKKYIRILQSLRKELIIGQQLFRDKNFGGDFNYLFQKYDRVFRFFEIPDAFNCGITFLIMEKPLCIITRNPIAHTYSSYAWDNLNNKLIDPYTKEQVIATVKNITLENAMSEWSEISKFFSDEQKMFKEKVVEEEYKKRRFEDIIKYIKDNIIPKVEEQHKEVKVFDEDSFTHHLIGAFDLYKYDYLSSLFCPKSRTLFQTPMINIRTGISYEKRYLKTKYTDRHISQHFRVNYKLNELLEFYKNILEKNYLGLQQQQIPDIDGGGFNF